VGMSIFGIIITMIFMSYIFVFITKFPARYSVHSFLQKKTKFNSPSHHEKQKNRQLIYIMGGGEKSLQTRFRKASELFHSGTGQKILVFIQPGITAYDQDLGRNMTNEEWAILLLKNLRIENRDVIFAEFEEGFFGTFSECRNLLKYTKLHGYDHVHIVTSTYHTQRTWLTFSTLSNDYQPISFAIHDTGDNEDTGSLSEEYGKLLFYKFILLPWL
jgi:hypothetical protein